jgi:nucleotide-binding universal stress UspA family protein
MTDIKRMVVGVDGSGCSYRAMQWAHTVATEHGADLLVVTTWRPQQISPATPGGMFVAATDVHPKKLAEEALSDALATLPASSATSAVRHEVIEGIAAKVLIDLSSEADLVVVGSQGHGAFAGMLLGSVSQHLVSHASCTVVVVR